MKLGETGKPATVRTYVLLAVLTLLVFIVFGGPLRGLLHERRWFT